MRGFVPSSALIQTVVLKKNVRKTWRWVKLLGMQTDLYYANTFLLTAQPGCCLLLTRPLTASSKPISDRVLSGVYGQTPGRK